jgi:hypothetical protein
MNPNNRKRDNSRPYTKGELNKIADSLLHPLFTKNPSCILLDTLVHALIEQNPPDTIKKFIKYNLSKY